MLVNIISLTLNVTKKFPDYSTAFSANLFCAAKNKHLGFNYPDACFLDDLFLIIAL